MTTEEKQDHRHRYCRRRWKAFYLLSRAQRGLTAREWAQYSGLPLHSLQSAATLWVRYHYIKRDVTAAGFVYSLLTKGQRFVDDGYLVARIRRAELIQQIIDYQHETGLLHD